MNACVADTPLSSLSRTEREAQFTDYVRCHRNRLTAVAQRILRDAGDVEDAVQDALHSAWRALPGFAERSQLATWLHRIVVNAALIKLRSRRRSRSVPVAAQLGDDFPDWTPAADTPTPTAICETAEDVAGALSALADLPEKARRVVQLRVLDRLNTKETARILRISPDAVKVRLFRALRTMRDQIQAGAVTKAA